MQFVDYFWSPLLFLKYTVWLFGWWLWFRKSKATVYGDKSPFLNYFINPLSKTWVPLSQDGATAGKCQLVLLIACGRWVHIWWERYLLDLEILDGKGSKVKIHRTIWFLDLVHRWHCGKPFMHIHFLTSPEKILLGKQSLFCVQKNLLHK